jgi:hypothetical protein
MDCSKFKTEQIQYNISARRRQKINLLLSLLKQWLVDFFDFYLTSLGTMIQQTHWKKNFLVNNHASKNSKYLATISINPLFINSYRFSIMTFCTGNYINKWGVCGHVVKIIDFKPLILHSCAFESHQGLWILSCEKTIQLAYGMSMVRLRCPFTPEIIHIRRSSCTSHMIFVSAICRRYTGKMNHMFYI